MSHGETIQSSLLREIEEEIGVAANKITSDFEIAHYDIGSVVSGVPRMNLFFKVSLPKELVKKTDEVTDIGWFTKDEFMDLYMNLPYVNREELAEVIFGEI